MNKEIRTLIGVTLIGVLVGWLTTIFPKVHLQGHYLANAASVITPTNKVIYNQSSINIEFKKNNSYDLLYVSTKQAGFTSSGSYTATQHNISLDESAHEQILPNRELEFYEKVMISEGSVLSSDAMPYIPLNDDELLLVTQNGMIHFCKKMACPDLPTYSNTEPELNIN
ncbi:hypothetical protein BCU90_04510 [Vibrio lentus]|uniref:Uncharacterized protein n=1 Tax=Vibrio lentus TaxID=136468 RepID=A0A4U2FAJ0_9VIBR|nr:hypothetical protein [Vibrio lentus]MCC4818064.1 hypothetical protein [Vibrio lentus]MCC4856511.1 hypothetical protein [Vibrio lentus]MCZ8502723.1 hypothetical protein [Vibrio lentus]MDN3628518.1 hypothetical protein [Vibrio lentus]OMO28520.1 hypothetical protein BH583_00105 [Vibrio lentus]